MRYFLCYILLLNLSSCQSGLEKYDCQKLDYIEVYHISFGAMSPINVVTEKNIKKSKAKEILNKQTLIEICNRLLSLKEIEGNSLGPNVYLRADFIYKDEQVLTILSDGFLIKIGRKLYNWDEDLIDLLIQDYYRK